MISAMIVMFIVGVLFGPKFAGDKETEQIESNDSNSTDGYAWFRFTGEHDR